jgi:hypothetical protein
LILVEWDLGQPGAARDAKFADLQMMVGNGGRARCIDHYADLLADAGFCLERSTPTPIGLTVMESVPVRSHTRAREGETAESRSQRKLAEPTQLRYGRTG